MRQDESAFPSGGGALGVTTPRPDARVGRTLAGKYRVERRLGAGGMGVVYQATNTWTERSVALKILAGDGVGRVTLDAVTVDRFLLEAKVASRIAHPNVVSVFDLGRDDDGTLFIVQELLVGPTLYEHVTDGGPLAPRRAYELLRPVMSALTAAHEAGVVHRDVKPENIILARGPEGRVTPTLLDFGVALVTEATRDARMTSDGQAVGTPSFMSPEQASGLREIDARTDVWAMALVWIEALTGRRVFDGQNYNEVCARVLTQPIPTVRTTCSVAPPELAAALDRALRRARDERHATMADFTAAVDAAFEASTVAVDTPRGTIHRRRALAVAAVAAVGVVTAIALVDGASARQRAAESAAPRRVAPTAVDPERRWSDASPQPQATDATARDVEAQHPTPATRDASTRGRAPSRSRPTANPVNAAPILEL